MSADAAAGHGDHGPKWYATLAKFFGFGLGAFLAFYGIAYALAILGDVGGPGLARFTSALVNSRQGILMLTQTSIMVALSIAAISFSLSINELMDKRSAHEADMAKVKLKIAEAEAKAKAKAAAAPAAAPATP